MESTVRDGVLATLSNLLFEEGVAQPPALTDDLLLLSSGLDSLGFAVLVARLEDDLGYDPFTMMDDPVYPRTLGEFIGVYERFAPEP